MCSRVFKGMVLLAALGMATIVGAVLGGSAVYVLNQIDDVSPDVEIRTGDRRSSLPSAAPRSRVVWGVVVLAVIEDSPASLAGLRAGDVIIALDGAPIVSPGSLAVTIAQQEPGDEIELTVYRPAGREKSDIEVTLGEHPTVEGKAYLGAWLDASFGRE